MTDPLPARPKALASILPSRHLSMLPPRCFSCDHVNPAGRKFCPDCGSPLRFKRCNRCNAVNDQAAKYCSNCSAEFPVLSTPSEAPLISSARDITAASPALSEGFSYFKLAEFPEPAPPVAEVTAAAPASFASEAALATTSS